MPQNSPAPSGRHIPLLTELEFLQSHNYKDVAPLGLALRLRIPMRFKSISPGLAQARGRPSPQKVLTEFTELCRIGILFILFILSSISLPRLIVALKPGAPPDTMV
jgi:hypothetical protein